MKQSGVYYREYDLTEIASADGSVPAGIVLVSKRGRSNEVFRVTSARSFIDEYGQPDARISFSGYSALAYLEQGNTLWCKRVVGTGAKYGCLLLRQENSASQPRLYPIVLKDPNGFDFFSDSYTDADGKPLAGGINIALFYPKGQGSYSSDLGISIVSSNIDPVPDDSFTVTAVTGGGSLPADTYYYQVSAINSQGETISTQVKSAALVTNNSSMKLKWTKVLGATGYRIYGRTRNLTTDPLPLLYTVNGNEWLDTGEEEEDSTVVAPAKSTIVPTEEFSIEVYDKQVSEGTSIKSLNVTLSDYVDGLGNQLRLEDVVNSANTEFKVISNVKSLSVLPRIKPIARTSAPAGDSGAAILDRDIILGWQSFLSSEDLMVRLLINGGYATPSVQKAMLQVCETRQDCVALLDTPPLKQRAQDAADYRKKLNINSSRACIFAQDLLIQDVYQGRQIYVPPSGYMAALVAKVSALDRVWLPIAGLNRGKLNVLDVRERYDEGDRELLKTSQVNSVRDFKGSGLCLFEQNTLQTKVSALSWLSIRLLMDEIRIAMVNYAWYSVHEINDDFLRAQIVSALADLLQTYQDRRAISRFLVVSDDRNNPDIVTAAGKLNVEVFIVPNYPTDQIYLNSILTKQSADFSEYVGKFI